MAAFGPDDFSRYDYSLLLNGGVSLVWSRPVWDDGISSLTTLGYRVVRLSASRWTNSAEMFCQLAESLDFPDYFGHDFDAFVDTDRRSARMPSATSAHMRGNDVAERTAQCHFPARAGN